MADDAPADNRMTIADPILADDAPADDSMTIAEPTPTSGRTASAEPGSIAGGSDLPRWFHLGTLAAAVLVATSGSLGLLLAINDAYRTWLVLLIAVPVTAVLVVGMRRGASRPSVSRAGHIGGALALVLAVAYAAFVGLTPSQHVVLNRDPAAYELVGRWIADSGSVDVDAKGDAFEGIDGLVYRGAASYDVPAVERDAQGRAIGQASGDLQVQFNHLTSVLLAISFDVGGAALLFRAPAIAAALGLLLVYAVAVRATRRPILSLVAPLLLAASMPLLYVARDTFSETFALVLLWGGLFVLLDAHERPSPWVGVAGGVLLGSVGAARVDALIYLILLFPLAAVSVGAARPGPARRARVVAWLTAVVTAGLVSLIGWVDLNRHSGSYPRDLRDDLHLLRLALLASVVVSVVVLAVWLAWPALRRAAQRCQRPGAWVAAAAVVLALLALWLVRPLVQEVQASRLVTTTAGIQRRDGLTVEPRSYAEHSLWWMAWYLGIPALVAAIAGLGLSAFHTVRGRATAAAAAVFTLTVGGGAAYWWDPSITPSHPWATRRFIPAVFPGLAVMVVVAIAFLVAVPLFRRRAPALRVLGGVALVAVLIVPAGSTTWPVRWQRSQGGHLRPITETCDALPENAAVIIVGNYEAITLQQTLRSWCEVPVAAQGRALSGAEDARAIATTLDERGYQLFLVGTRHVAMQYWANATGHTFELTAEVKDAHTVAETLTGPPDEYVRPERALPLEGPFRLYRMAVDPAGGFRGAPGAAGP